MRAKKFHLCYIILTAVTLVFVSCQYDPHAHLLTTTEPRSEDIVGTYVLDRLDLPQNINIQKLDMRIELHVDGTFTATNIPSRKLEDPDDSLTSKLLSGKGHWRKSTMGMVDPGSKQFWGIYFRSDQDQFHTAQLLGNKPPYGIIFTLGDPDSGNAIILKKE